MVGNLRFMSLLSKKNLNTRPNLEFFISSKRPYAHTNINGQNANLLYILNKHAPLLMQRENSNLRRHTNCV